MRWIIALALVCAGAIQAQAKPLSEFTEAQWQALSGYGKLMKLRQYAHHVGYECPLHFPMSINVFFKTIVIQNMREAEEGIQHVDLSMVMTMGHMFLPMFCEKRQVDQVDVVLKKPHPVRKIEAITAPASESGVSGLVSTDFEARWSGTLTPREEIQQRWIENPWLKILSSMILLGAR